MRLSFHVHHHFDLADRILLEKVVGALNFVKDSNMALSAKLQAAIDDVNARMGQVDSELDAVLVALQGQASIAAAAVAAALAKVGVDEDAAAPLIETAFNTMKEHADATFAAIGVSPPNTTGTGGTDTTGGGDDTISGGNGDDSITLGGGTGDDTITGGQGNDVIEPVALAITTTSLSTATAGAGYTDTIGISGGTGPYTVQASPPTDNGFSISSGGGVSGTPTEARDTVFNISVQDSATPPNTTLAMVTVPVVAAAA